MGAHRCSVHPAGARGAGIALASPTQLRRKRESTMRTLAIPAVSRDPPRRSWAFPTTACSGEGQITEVLSPAGMEGVR
jgi:hypothetical protein